MGLTSSKREGDLKTPKGNFKIKLLFYRADRIKNIHTKIKKIRIKKNFGWCDDVNSEEYNKLIYFPFKKSAEKLYLKKNIYDLILVTSFNSKPVVKKGGSAIFLHIASRKLNPTKGCIAVQKKDLIKMLPFITQKTKLIIS